MTTVVLAPRPQSARQPLQFDFAAPLKMQAAARQPVRTLESVSTRASRLSQNSLQTIAQTCTNGSVTGISRETWERALNLAQCTNLRSMEARALEALSSFDAESGDWRAAELALLRVVSIRTQIHGANHPEVARSLNALAEVYYVQKNYFQAENTCQQALDIYTEAHGFHSEGTAMMIANLAMVFHACGRFKAAAQYYRQAIALHHQLFGWDHPKLESMIMNLTNVLRASGNSQDEAESLMRRLWSAMWCTELPNPLLQ